MKPSRRSILKSILAVPLAPFVRFIPAALDELKQFRDQESDRQIAEIKADFLRAVRNRHTIIARNPSSRGSPGAPS